MNISDYILTFLTQYNSVEVKGFGVFSFENSKAEVKATENIILPPAKKVLFTSNEKVEGIVFLNYLSQQKGVSLENAEFELQTQVDFWQKKQLAKDEFSVGKLGDFKKENERLVFKGKRIEKQSPDYFGLEKISFSDFIQTKVSNAVQHSKDHPLTKYVLWLFLILLPILGIAYAFYTYQDVILGKKKMSEIKTSTHRIDDTQKTPLIIKDKPQSDSLFNEQQPEINIENSQPNEN